MRAARQSPSPDGPPDGLACSAARVLTRAPTQVTCRWWTPEAQPNPYMGLLAWADYLLVTADSVNMVRRPSMPARPAATQPIAVGLGRTEHESGYSADELGHSTEQAR